MSVSKWAWTEECDARICVGDCDLCSFAEDNTEEDWVGDIKCQGK